MDIFIKRLNQLIEENKITRYKLAKEIKVNKQTVIFWCNGESEPSISGLLKLAIYFDVSADYLLGLEDESGCKNYITNSFNNNNGSISFKG